MTSEQFHDALTLLSADLVAQAEEYRCRKPRAIPLKPYAATAACLAIVLCAAALFRVTQQKSTQTDTAVSFSAMQDAGAAPAEAPRMEAAAVPSCPMAETPDLPNTAKIDHSAAIITSRSELEAYFTEMGEFYQLDELKDACAVYDEAWFAQNDLLLIPVDNVSPSCTVTDVSLTNGTCEITLTGEKTEEGTSFHIALPVDKGAVTDAENVTIIYYSDTNS